jgi:hypothetical protein
VKSSRSILIHIDHILEYNAHLATGATRLTHLQMLRKGRDNHMAIFVDRTSGKTKRYKTGICHYCDHNKYPNGKIIDPSTDRNAIQMKDGSWKCGVCNLDTLKKVTSLFNRQKGVLT